VAVPPSPPRPVEVVRTESDGRLVLRMSLPARWRRIHHPTPTPVRWPGDWSRLTWLHLPTFNRRAARVTGARYWSGADGVILGYEPPFDPDVLALLVGEVLPALA